MLIMYNSFMMTKSIRDIELLKENSLKELNEINTLDALDAWRLQYLGRSGSLTQLLRSVSELPVEQRKTVGSAANAVKVALEDQLHLHREAIEFDSLAKDGQDFVDISLPGRNGLLGRYHPSTLVIREISAIFANMGFQIIDGPEVEWDRYNFEMLNIPQDHPARDMFDTFWLDINRQDDGAFTTLLRTHTSPMQARVMESNDPPVRVIIPGKCYRYEATDATHESQFHQIEGLAVDKGITFANLKHTLFEFARQMFGADTKVRFRCDYFPFVEPGVDMSIEWKGKWLEILGAGMVHPNVLRAVGYDPSIYSGFAFGMGPERIAMLKYGINDIRHFLQNDIRFLRQF
jgi:phenylalanyl-tRNA synthetase alpha chain